MSKGPNQRLKLLYLLKILTEETDEKNALTIHQIIERLNECGVNADRKTFYEDIRALEDFGIDIVKEHRGRQYYYSCGERDFQLVEVKMLVDAAQSMKFLTEKKTGELVNRLEGLLSRHDAVRLHEHLIREKRVKASTETIYYNIDKIHGAIIDDCCISYRYCQWDAKKALVPRHRGKRYRVSPWQLMWDHDYYYLVAYDMSEKKIKHFRVDKMIDVEIIPSAREGRKVFEASKAVDYRAAHFGMFAGEVKRITLVAKNSLAGVVIDQFGRDVEMVPIDDEYFKVYADTAVTDVFIGWLIGVGRDIKITSPDEAVQAVKDTIRRLNDAYGVFGDR